MHCIFCFQIYLEKVKNEVKFVETTTSVIGGNDAEFGYSLNFFDYLLPLARFEVMEFFL